MYTSVFLLACIAVSMLVCDTADAAQVEQRRFSAEGESVKHPASIPPAVNRILAHDPDVMGVLEYEHLATDAVPGSWLLTSEIHLNSARHGG
ncbi:MAG: hypothetical protein ABSG13_12505 [Bryobacteraceae bacterium]|jgi:hypothetical protein